VKTATVTFDVIGRTTSVSSDGDFLHFVDVPADPIYEVRNVGEVAITFQFVAPGERIEDGIEPVCLAIWGPEHPLQSWIALSPAGVYGEFRWYPADNGVTLRFTTSGERWAREFRLSFTYRLVSDPLTQIVVVDPKIYNDGRDP
jgi:hypothetical protein